MPKLSSSIFDLSSLETSNSFNPLEDQTLGNLNSPPTASSTPKKQRCKRMTYKKGTPLKILNIDHTPTCRAERNIDHTPTCTAERNIDHTPTCTAERNIYKLSQCDRLEM